MVENTVHLPWYVCHVFIFNTIRTVPNPTTIIFSPTYIGPTHQDGDGLNYTAQNITRCRLQIDPKRTYLTSPTDPLPAGHRKSGMAEGRGQRDTNWDFDRLPYFSKRIMLPHTPIQSAVSCPRLKCVIDSNTVVWNG